MSQEVMNTLVDMSQEIIKLKDQNRELLGALKDAACSIEDWGSHASPHFRVKHDLLGDIAKARKAIAKAEGEKA